MLAIQQCSAKIENAIPTEVWDWSVESQRRMVDQSAGGTELGSR